MNPGQLDREVILLQPLVSISEGGSSVTQWTGAGADWARMRPVSVADRTGAAGQVIPSADTIWTLRYRSDITSAWRIRHEGRDYALTGPPFEVSGRRAFIDCPSRSVPLAAIDATP